MSTASPFTRSLPLALAFALPALAAARVGSASPSEHHPASKIDAVTVYRAGARVTRVARVELPAGVGRIVFDGLPLQLDQDSVRVAAHGTAKARLFGVDVQTVTTEGASDAEARAAIDRVERLEDEDHALEDRIATAKGRLAFVDSLRSTYSEERAKNLAVRGVPVKEWADLAQFVQREREEALRAQRSAEQDRRDLARRLTQARADLQKLQSKEADTTAQVSVEVEAEKAGTLELALTYDVGSAWWRPVWDARLDPDTGKIELALYASTSQGTGEDWNDVTFAVSTAQPGRGLQVPELDPVYLTRLEPPRPRMPMPASAPAPAAMEAAKPEEHDLYARSKAAVAADEMVAEQVEATVHEGLLSASFTAPRRDSLAGNGTGRKIALARFPLRGELIRTTAPRAEAAAFLTAKAINGTGVPLLPGEVSLYVGEDYAGKGQLPMTPAGGELHLAFGRDDRIEVDRKVLDRKHETEGLINKDDVWRYRVRIGLKNRYATEAKVKLLDLVPVSREEKIVVELLDGTTPATREDPERPGVRIHELTLAPREEKVVELRYRVRFPRGFPVAGLE